jgi:isopenicillin N synthase-like dioxygenase
MDRTLQLEVALQHGLGLPAGVSVFAVRRHDEPYAPPIPLVLCGGLHACSLDVLLELDVLARPIYQVHAAPEASPASASAVRFALLGPDADPRVRAAEAARLLSALQVGGVARLSLTPPLRDAIAHATEATHKFFACSSSKASARWVRIDGTARSERGAGHVDGSAREYLQVRRAFNSRGAPSTAVPAATPPPINRLFVELEQAAVVVLSALALALAQDDQAFATVLDAPFCPAGTAPSAGTAESASASVLRCYLYKPSSAEGAGALSNAVLQGAHADLGLLTLSPLSSVPTLEAWDHERLGWRPVEREAHAAGGCDVLVFAGETLSLLTAGRVPAVLHKVDMRGAGLHGIERVSMPFFLRARPHAQLRAIDRPGAKPPSGQRCALADDAASTTAEFMSHYLFARRPWRAAAAGGRVPDY